tara:strand:- start:409 stop:558 length:150 start_codon:yes stop_codon:yes gene_type:complete
MVDILIETIKFIESQKWRKSVAPLGAGDIASGNRESIIVSTGDNFSAMY